MLLVELFSPLLRFPSIALAVVVGGGGGVVAVVVVAVVVVAVGDAVVVVILWYCDPKPIQKTFCQLENRVLTGCAGQGCLQC